MTAEAPTIRDSVRRWAESAPDRVCLVCHTGDGAPEPATYGQLSRHASAYSRRFRSEGLKPGDSVVLFAHTAIGFVAALLGAQDAGLVGVPCPAPEPLESARRVAARVGEILARSGARALLDVAMTEPDAELAAAVATSGAALLGPTAPDDDASSPFPSLRSPFSYCQFTSGSGGRAKGVLLTHENVAHNVRAIVEGVELTEADVGVSWLPLYHDMGLVAFALCPLVTGYPAHLLPPLKFILRPVSWLDLISRVRGTLAASPNFGFALCTRKVSDEDRAQLDLSSWRLAFNGSESVTRAVVDGFAERFAACGFRPSSMLPCYGLAENTLCVTTRRPGEGTRFEDLSREDLARDGVARIQPSGLSVASLGRPIGGQEVAILDAGGSPRPERAVGEIAVRGDSVMHGYLAGTLGELVVRPDGWLLTGDLGYLAGGELYVVGRKKDLIIRGGRNYYPQDLEDAAAGVAGVRVGRAVAFSVPADESERVVLAVEVRREWDGDRDALKASVRDAVFRTVRLVPDDILLVQPSTLPLTSSGKVMRPEARRLCMEGQLSLVETERRS